MQTSDSSEHEGLLAVAQKQAEMATRRVYFVIFSSSMAALQDGDGYWSNDAGWTSFVFADRFSQSESETLNLPAVHDAQWIPCTTIQPASERALTSFAVKAGDLRPGMWICRNNPRMNVRVVEVGHASIDGHVAVKHDFGNGGEPATSCFLCDEVLIAH